MYGLVLFTCIYASNCDDDKLSLLSDYDEFFVWAFKKLLLKLIWFYQHAISPYKGRSYCNYYPTSSESATEAVTEYGAFKGGFMALKRILRCNPFVKGGYDPVPVKGAVNVKKITK